jgi:N-formylglutamate amidohydrolase
MKGDFPSPASEGGFFDILAPREWTIPIVLNSPHSGQHIPPELLEKSRLSDRELRRSEDAFVDELFAGCVDLGVPMLRALLSRAYMDLNREPYEFDQRMFGETLPGFMNTTSPRVLCGLGTIPRVVAEGEEIYSEKLSVAAAIARVEHIYRPYHQALSALLSEAFDATGFVVLVDCHSMPASAVNQHLGRNSIDVVLGDRFGRSCDADIVNALEKSFEDVGMSVRRNRPYAGGFITETYGNPRNGRHAVQIEINRSIYMDEHKLKKTSNYAAVHKAISAAMELFIGTLPAVHQTKAAAE